MPAPLAAVLQSPAVHVCVHSWLDEMQGCSVLPQSCLLDAYLTGNSFYEGLQLSSQLYELYWQLRSHCTAVTMSG